MTPWGRVLFGAVVVIVIAALCGFLAVADAMVPTTNR